MTDIVERLRGFQSAAAQSWAFEAADEIVSLRQQLAECQAQNNNFRHLLRELWRHEDPDDWDDEFAAEVSTACK